MTLSVPRITLLAKQFEIEELKRLKARSHLVGATGHMIHVLQSERGASSIFLASNGKRFKVTRQQLISESESVEKILRKNIKAELDNASFTNARIISLTAWVLLGLDALPELRKRINARHLSGNESVAAFSRLIAGLIALIFEVADAAIDPEISQLLVALFNLVQGKELAGQERAVGALLFGSGTFSDELQQRLMRLVDAQQHNFLVVAEFAEAPIMAKWHDLQNQPYVHQLEKLRQILTAATTNTPLDTNLSDSWFECCTERINGMWSLQCDMVESLHERCVTLISAAERDLLDSESLLKALRDKPPARAELVDRFFDPELPVEQSLGFISPGQHGRHQAHSIIELLQAQSQRLANVESELSAARRALNERKIVERAKGILMARFHLTEDEAYRKMRSTAMQQNRRLVEVAEAALDTLV